MTHDCKACIELEGEEEYEKLESQCAEMRACLEMVQKVDSERSWSDKYDDWKILLDRALSSDAGKGWKSPKEWEKLLSRVRASEVVSEMPLWKKVGLLLIKNSQDQAVYDELRNLGWLSPEDVAKVRELILSSLTSDSCSQDLQVFLKKAICFLPGGDE